MATLSEYIDIFALAIFYFLMVKMVKWLPGEKTGDSLIKKVSMTFVTLKLQKM
jgi:hypothetical protein